MNKEKFRGFHKKTIQERQELIIKEFNLSKEEVTTLKKEGSLPLTIADRMSENVFSTIPLPYGIATNFVIDEKDYLIPFAIEEPSVVAAASNAAKLSNGFTTSADEPIMIGLIQLINCPNATDSLIKILAKKKEVLELAKSADAILEKIGGGPRELKGEVLRTSRGEMISLQLLVDVRDAMGSNAVNTMLEKISPLVEELSGGVTRLKIISNLAIYRRARAKTVWKKSVLEEKMGGTYSGVEIIERILDSHEFAIATPFRTVTHNKGVMNGVDALAIATGNDFRGVEAAAHAFALQKQIYSPLTKYYKNEEGDLVGEIELPMVLATIGGTIKSNPMAQISLKIMGVTSSQELARVGVAVGLAQNFAALFALSTVGIQKGHMKLHAKSLAVQAGATEDEASIVTQKLIESNLFTQLNAEEIIRELRKK